MPVTTHHTPATGGWQPVIGAIFWCGYLICLLLMSFMTGPFDTSAWLYFSAGFYLFFAVFLIAAFRGMHCNWRALKKARLVIVCLLLTLLWLFLQIVIPGHESLLRPIDQTLTAPAWFNPELSLSIAPEKTRWLLFSDIFVFAWFLMSMLVLDSRRRVKQLLTVLLIIGSIHASVGIMAMFADVHLVDRDQLDGHFRVARGWFVNRNHFAALLNLLLVGSFSYCVKNLLVARTGPRMTVLLNQLLSPTILYFAAALVILIGVIMSQSRGGLASILLASLVVLVVSRFNHLRIRVSWQSILFLLFLGAILLVYLGQELLMRFVNEAFSLGERTTQWQITWQAIKRSLMFGYGGGSYATVFQVFREYTDLRQVSFNQSHNDYLQLWLEQGLFGLLLWITPMVLTIRFAFVSIGFSRSTLVSSVEVASLVVIFAALLQAGVDFNLQIINIRCFFFVIIALVFATPVVNHHSGSTGNFSKRSSRFS